MTSNTADISLSFETVDYTVDTKQVNVEYYWREESGAYTFRAIPGQKIEKRFENQKEIYEIKNIHITDLPEGGKFAISRIFTDDNKEVNIRLDNHKTFNFYTQAVISEIRNEEAETSANLRITFIDKQESLNNKIAKVYFKEIKEDGTVEGQPQLEVEGQIVGSILRVEPKGLKKLQKYLIERIEVLDFKKDPKTQESQSQVLDFSSRFDEKQKTFATNVKSAEIQKITFSDNTETSIKSTLEFNADEKFLEYYTAQLQYAVVAAQDKKDETNLLFSDTYQTFTKQADGKFTIDFELKNLQSGNAFIVKGLKLVPKSNLTQKNLVLNNLDTTFNPLLDGSSLLFYTLPVISDITFTPNKTSANLNIVFNNAFPADTKNSFFTKDKNKKIKAKVFYKLYTGANPSSANNSEEKSIETTIFQNGINNLEISGLTGAKIYHITKIEVLENYTSSKNSNNILEVSAALDETKKFFSTVAETINVTKIENTARDQDNSTITITLSKNATDILQGKTVLLQFNKLGSSKIEEVEAQLKPTNGNDDPKIEFKVSQYENKPLELGTKYIINNIKLKSDLSAAEQNSAKDSALLTQILFDKNIKTSDKSFFTSSGILEITYKNDIERTIGVVIQLADALGEYRDKYAVLNYKLVEQTGVQLQDKDKEEKHSISAPIINNRVVFNLTDLVKKGKYQLIENQGLEIVDNPNVLQPSTLADSQKKIYVPFKKTLTSTDPEKQKSQFFSTVPKTANIDKIEIEQSTKNTAKFKLTLNDLDSYLNNQKIVVKYRKLGSLSDLLTQESTLNVTNKDASFELKNLDDGSVYNIVSFEKAQNDVEPIVFYTNQIDNEHKTLKTRATLKSVEVDTKKEASAKIVLRFNDTWQDIIGKKIKVTIKNQNNQKLTNEQIINTNLPFYTFRFDNLSKTDQYEIEKIEVDDQAVNAQQSNPNFSQILQPTIKEQENEIKQNSTFRISASKAVVEKIEFLDTQADQIKVKLTFDKDSKFIEGQKVKISYRNISDVANKTETISVPVEIATISDDKKTVEFSLQQLKSGDKYQVLKVELEENNQKPILGKNKDFNIVFSTKVDSEASLEKRFFVPTPTIDTINWEQPTESAFRINFKLHDNSGSLNNRKAKITYKDKDQQQPQSQTLVSDMVAVQNSNFSISLGNLTKAKNYEIEKIEISDDSQAKTFTELAGFSKLDTSKKEQYLNPWTTEITSIHTSTEFVTNSEKNSATIKLNFKDTDRFLIGRKLKITLKANVKDGQEKVVEATVTDSSGNTVIDDHSLQDLDPATIYKIVKIKDISSEQEAQNHPKLKNIFFANSVSDDQRLLVTKPVVTQIKVVNNGETARTIYISIKDPLKNFKNDQRTFEGKKLKITYEKKSATGSTEESQEVGIQNSNAKLELSNLTKDETYVIKSVEWAENPTPSGRTRRATPAFTKFYLWKFGQNGQVGNVISEDERTFHIMPTTARTSSLSFSSVTADSAKVSVSFDQLDSFLSKNATYQQHLQLRYLASGSGKIQTANLVYKQNSSNFEADLTNLPYGSNIIVTGISYDKQSATSDLKITFDDQSQQNKTFGTLPAVSRIENKSDPNSETSWNIDVFFKDTPRKLEGHKVVLKYQKVDIKNQQEQLKDQEMSSQEFEVKNSRVAISLTNLVKYQNYKILGLYWNPADKSSASTNYDSILIKTEDLVKNFDDRHKTLATQLQTNSQTALIESQKTGQIFKTIPETQSITNIEYKSITSNSAQLEVSFDAADNNYLNEFTKIQLNYRNVNNTSSSMQPITAIATKDNGTNTYKASFTLSNLQVGQYEITSIEYQQGSKINRVRYTQTQTLPQEKVNQDNPENVRIEFGQTVLPTQKIFTTLTSIKQILIPQQEVRDTSARIEVELNDTAGIFNGSTLALKVYKKNEPNRFLNLKDALVISSSSRAIFLLDDLDKNTQYVVSEVRLKQNQKDLKLQEEVQSSSPASSSPAKFEKEFTTTTEYATVVKITDETNSLSTSDQISKAKVKLEFDAKDKFLKDKNISLYLKYTAILEGNPKYSTQAKQVTESNGEYSIEFELDKLSAGSEYKIDGLFMSNQDMENQKGLQGNITTLINIDQTKVTSQQQIFKTEVAISRIVTNTSETTANVLVTLDNSQNKEFKDTDATIVFTKENDQIEISKTQVTKLSNSQFLFQLNDLVKIQKYQIKAIKLTESTSSQQVEYNFVSTFDNEQKKFETDIDSVNVQVSANQQNKDDSGEFTLKVNQNEENILNKYQVQINYQSVDKSEAQKVINWTDLTQNNQVFNVSQLSNGQQYQITNIQLKLKNTIQKTDPKLLQVIPVTITNPEPVTNNTIYTNTSIKSISSVSTFEKQATVTIELNNNNKIIQQNKQLQLTYQLVKQGIVVNNGQTRTKQASFSAADNKVVFNLDGLEKGSQYQIVKLETDLTRVQGFANSQIKFADTVKDPDKKFDVAATTADITYLTYEQITTRSAKVKVRLKQDDKFLLSDNGNDIVLSYRNASDNVVLTSQPASLRQQGNELEIEYQLNNLLPGTKYEIEKIISLKYSISVQLDNSINTTSFQESQVNRKAFYTHVEVSDIQLDKIQNPNNNNQEETRALDHSANVKVVFADKEKTLRGQQVKLTIKQGSTIGLSNTSNNTKEVAAVVQEDNQNQNQVYATFNLTSLVKWTNYTVETVTHNATSNQPQNNQPIQFDSAFNPRGDKEAKKHFQTSGDVIDILKTIQAVDIQNPKKTTLILEVNELNAAIMKDKSYQIEFEDKKTQKKYISSQPVQVRNDYNDSFGGQSLTNKNILRFDISKDYVSEVQQNGQVSNQKTTLDEGHKFQVTKITEISLASNTKKIAVGIPQNTNTQVLQGTETNPLINTSVQQIPEDQQIIFQTIYDYPTVERLYAGETTLQLNGKWKTTLKLKFNDPNNTLVSNKKFPNSQFNWWMEKSIVKVKFNNQELYLNWTKDNTHTASSNGYEVKNASFDQSPGVKELSFDLEATDIKSLIGQDIKVSVIEASYNWIETQTYVETVFSKNFTSRFGHDGITKTVYGEEIKTKIRPKLYIEQATSTMNYDKDLFGFTIAVYDPTGLIKTTNDQENSWANDRWTVEKVNKQSFNLQFEPVDIKVTPFNYNNRFTIATQENVWTGNKDINEIFNGNDNSISPQSGVATQLIAASQRPQYIQTLSAADYAKRNSNDDGEDIFSSHYAFVTFFYDLTQTQTLKLFGAQIAELDLSKIKILQDSDNPETNNLTIYNPSGRKRWLIDPMISLNEFITIDTANGGVNSGNLKKGFDPFNFKKQNNNNNNLSLNYSSNTLSSQTDFSNALTSNLYIKRWTYNPHSNINNVKVYLSRPNNFMMKGGWNNWAALAMFMDEDQKIYFAGDDLNLPVNLFNASSFRTQDEVELNFSLKNNLIYNQKNLTFLGVLVKDISGAGYDTSSQNQGSSTQYIQTQFLIDPTNAYKIHRTIKIR
ncbi:DUF1410 domain-containing protein [Mycoplasma sp. 1654_15]|uniref:DUF1410 domain-containing protein n=1 Tax=Mycoplasma sp. 1654_15 TaxID=2725994 RepID=UPI00159728AA|nr:DUF1410 domain-containing protein [Mycoplasma sp. 1654_15]QKG28205.1 hypothetical protein HF996_03174 [Mycoplasma sp. 1654_15]